MKIQDQVYKQVQVRLDRICRDEYLKALGKRKRLTKPLTYSSEVDTLIKYLSVLCECNENTAIEIHSEITTGEIQNKFLKN